MTDTEKKNNIFCNWLADDVFKLDIIEKVFNDYKASLADKGIEVTKAMADETLYEYFQGMQFVIEDFLKEKFEGE